MSFYIALCSTPGEHCQIVEGIYIVLNAAHGSHGIFINVASN